jgi:hypothetical protein
MALRVEFDAGNKILLLHFDGQLLDDSVPEFSQAIRRYWTAVDARMSIVDLLSVTEFSVSGNLIVRLTQQEPCIPNGTNRVIVAPKGRVFDLAHMFQILVENTRPALSVVHTMAEAFVHLGVQSPRFEPLQ